MWRKLIIGVIINKTNVRDEKVFYVTEHTSFIYG
jgi:hypothetical protein